MFDSELVDRVCNTLNIVLTNDGIYHADPVSNSSASFHLMNDFAKPGAQIVSITWDSCHYTWDEDNECIENVSEEELDRIVYDGQQMTFETGRYQKTYTNPNGFTLRHVMDLVLDFERESRSRTQWFGGVDVHHIFFEGITQNDRGNFEIGWGS